MTGKENAEQGAGWGFGWVAAAVVVALAGMALRFHATDPIADNPGELGPLAAARELLDCGFGSNPALGLHAALLALLRRGGDPETGAIWLGMLASLLSVVPVYGAARKLSGNAAAALAAAFWALGPAGILSSADISPAPLAGFFFAFAAWRLTAALSGSRVCWAAVTFGLLATAATPGKIYYLTLAGPAVHLVGPMGAALVILVLAAVAGLAATWRTPSRNLALGLLVLAVAGGVAAALLPGLIALPALPLCALAGAGVTAAPRAVTRRWKSRGAKGAAWATATVLALGGAAAGAAESEAINQADQAPVSFHKALLGLRQAAVSAGELSPPGGCPGPIICAASSFFPYYMNGAAGVLPPDPTTLTEAFSRGLCSYVVLDSQTIRSNAPGLKAALTGPAPAGAELVFRQYLLDFNLLVTVYRSARVSGPPAIKAPTPLFDANDAASLSSLHQWATEYGRQGKVEHQRQILEGILRVKPEDALAHREMMKVGFILGRFDGVSLDRAEEELRRYSFYYSNDPNLQSYRDTLMSLRKLQRAEWGN